MTSRNSISCQADLNEIETEYRQLEYKTVSIKTIK